MISAIDYWFIGNTTDNIRLSVNWTINDVYWLFSR